MKKLKEKKKQSKQITQSLVNQQEQHFTRQSPSASGNNETKN